MERPVVFQNLGQQLVGMLHIPNKSGESRLPAVLMLHGFTGHKIESHRLFVRAARRFADEGFVVFRFDFRGSGDSEGKFEDMTLSGELSDAVVALDLLMYLDEVDPSRIGVVGFSMGGCIAAMLAGRRRGDIKAVALWAAVSEDPPSTFERFLNPFREQILAGSSSFVEWAGYLIGRPFFEELPNIRPTQEIRSFDGDVLIVHGTDDQTVPQDHAKRLYQILMQRKKGHVELHLIENASHTFIRREHETKLLDLTAEFFKRYL